MWVCKRSKVTADNSVIRVRLVDEDVNASPEYHAISYVWGRSWQTAEILCKGAEIQGGADQSHEGSL